MSTHMKSHSPGECPRRNETSAIRTRLSTDLYHIDEEKVEASKAGAKAKAESSPALEQKVEALEQKVGEFSSGPLNIPLMSNSPQAYSMLQVKTDGLSSRADSPFPLKRDYSPRGSPLRRLKRNSSSEFQPVRDFSDDFPLKRKTSHLYNFTEDHQVEAKSNTVTHSPFPLKRGYSPRGSPLNRSRNSSSEFQPDRDSSDDFPLQRKTSYLYNFTEDQMKAKSNAVTYGPFPPKRGYSPRGSPPLRRLQQNSVSGFQSVRDFSGDFPLKRKTSHLYNFAEDQVEAKNNTVTYGVPPCNHTNIHTRVPDGCYGRMSLFFENRVFECFDISITFHDYVTFCHRR